MNRIENSIMTSCFPVEAGWALSLQLGHKSSVDAVAFSPDGRYALTCSVDGIIYVWDTMTGMILQQLRGRKPAVFSPDGQHILASCGDIACLFEIRTGQVILQLKHTRQAEGGTSLSVTDIAFSCDGLQAATSMNADHSICLWDIKTGKKRFQLCGVTPPTQFSKVFSLAFSPDGSRLFGCFGREAACVWDTGTGEELLRLESEGFERAIFSADGLRALDGFRRYPCIANLWNVEALRLKTDSKSNYLDIIKRLRDAATDEEPIKIKASDAAAFSSDGLRLVATINSGKACVYDANTGHELLQIEIHGFFDLALFSPDGAYVLFESPQKGIVVFDAKTGEAFRRPEKGAYADAVAFSPDSQKILIGEMGNSAYLVDVTTGKEILRFGGDAAAVSAVTFSPDGSCILSASTINILEHQHAVHVWETSTGKEVLRLDGYTSPIDALAFSADGQRILTACINSNDTEIRVHDAENGQALQRLEMPGEIKALSFSPDGKQVLAGFADNTIAIIDILTGAEVLQITWHVKDNPQPPQSITSIAFSPDGLYVLAGVRHYEKGWHVVNHGHSSSISGESDHFAWVWSSVTGSKIQCINGHKNRFNLIAASPDGRRILTAPEYHTASLWDIETGAEILQLTGHVGWINFADFSKVGQRIFTGSFRYSSLSKDADKPRQLCHVWDAETGEELQQLQDAFVFFSPDNKKVATKKDGFIQLRNAETGEEFYRIFPYRDGWFTLYPDGHYRCGGVERLALVRNGMEARPVDAEFEAHWRVKD
jgi:WD40 repeat protein